ncbi:MAG TPA: phosphotransferase, partial [Candidatus Nitrosotenuis sp.]|nr:phosphotransferase [Candidatus Nitrosotenuis sp.]
MPWPEGGLALVRRVWPRGRLAWRRLAPGGSGRAFWRVRCQGQSLVVMRSHSGQDFADYVRLGIALRGAGAPVPELVVWDPEGLLVAMEDAGDLCLQEAVRQAPDLEALYSLYSRTLEDLARFQGADLDLPPFDRAALRWETEYFAREMLAGRLGLDPRPLEEEFEALAERVARLPRVPMHRDFQSQNICLLADGSQRWLDFQGARRGPAGYDLAALLCDPYVALPAELRQRLRAAFPVADFVGCALQRLMQALGAYAFLSGRKGISRFQSYIEPALEILAQTLEEEP